MMKIRSKVNVSKQTDRGKAERQIDRNMIQKSRDTDTNRFTDRHVETKM
jgi:hypothetical protein